MAKNRYRNYDPQADSSKGTKATADTGPILDQTGGGCLCGCGFAPTSDKSAFLMGHDARYKGILLRAHVTGMPVTVKTDDNPKGKVTTALALAQKHEWGPKLKDAKAREAEKAANAPARATKAKGRQVGDKVKIKVGRWVKDAVVVFVSGDKYDAEYTDAKGNTKRVKNPKAA